MGVHSTGTTWGDWWWTQLCSVSVLPVVMCCHPRSLTLLGDCVTKYVPTYVPIFTGHRAIEH